jgi:hypothetical protein
MIPPNKRPSNEIQTTDDGREVEVPKADMEQWVVRILYIFSIITAGIITTKLNARAHDNTIADLFALIMITFLLFKSTSFITDMLKTYGPPAFESSITTVTQVFDFITTLSVFVTTSFALVLMSLWTQNGNLDTGEVLTLVICAVFIIYIVLGIFQELKNRAKRLATIKATGTVTPAPAAPSSMPTQAPALSTNASLSKMLHV